MQSRGLVIVPCLELIDELTGLIARSKVSHTLSGHSIPAHTLVERYAGLAESITPVQIRRGQITWPNDPVLTYALAASADLIGSVSTTGAI